MEVPLRDHRSVILKEVLKSASPHPEGSLTSWKLEKQIYVDAHTWFWTRRTECSTWVLSPKSGKLWTKSDQTARHSCGVLLGPKKYASWLKTS
uniref:Uncharacterized protein n=1 Tax=Anguilla anguilla TaxID=7936 RepID=A0A0E9XIP3_ANGAN